MNCALLYTRLRATSVGLLLEYPSQNASLKVTELHTDGRTDYCVTYFITQMNKAPVNLKTIHVPLSNQVAYFKQLMCGWVSKILHNHQGGSNKNLILAFKVGGWVIKGPKYAYVIYEWSLDKKAKSFPMFRALLVRQCKVQLVQYEMFGRIFYQKCQSLS